MSDAHMWLVTKFGLRDTPDIPKVVCRSKGDAKRWIAEQDPTLEITGERDDYIAATATGPYWVIRYTATRLPVAATATEETSR